MKLAYVRQTYEFHTGKVSELTRQLSFAGLAIIWLFKTGQDGAFQLPVGLLAPLLMLISTLALDWLHYAVSAIIWDQFQRAKEAAGVTESEDFDVPSKINWPANFFFFSKQFCVVVAYSLLLTHAFNAWSLR